MEEIKVNHEMIQYKTHIWITVTSLRTELTSWNSKRTMRFMETQKNETLKSTRNGSVKGNRGHKFFKCMGCISVQNRADKQDIP